MRSGVVDVVVRVDEGDMGMSMRNGMMMAEQ